MADDWEEYTKHAKYIRYEGVEACIKGKRRDSNPFTSESTVFDRNNRNNWFAGYDSVVNYTNQKIAEAMAISTGMMFPDDE